MNDIIPPKRPMGTPPRPPVVPPNRTSTPSPRITAPQNRPMAQMPIPPAPLPRPPQKEESRALQLKPKKRSKKKLVIGIIVGIIILLLALMASAFLWYNAQLQPVSSGEAEKIRITIPTGATANQIGQLLEEKKLIRSSLAFDIYIRLSPGNPAFRAGTYSVSPADSTGQIVEHLVTGDADELVITFLPGATLIQNREVLLKAGFAPAEIDAAFGKSYQHPLFAGKPQGMDLEGYIYGESYRFESATSVEQILIRTFDEFYKVIEDNNLAEKYNAHGFNLYQGITLASIVQREVSRADDQKQVAQVFYKRLAESVPLGADATFVYGAEKLGVDPSVSLDSPYNTRIHAGLPPGPIATPGKGALLAVADPAAGDYLYFVSGDDGTTHFSRTQEEHDANTRQYCRANCSLF